MADEIRSAIIIDTSKSLDNLKNLENEFNNLNQSGEEFKQKQSDIEKAMSDNAISALNNAKSIGEMRKAIKEVTSLQLKGILSESESRRLSSALGEAKDRVADLREETAAMAGTRVEILTNNFARLKESIFNLDLDKFKSSLAGMKQGLTGGEAGFKGLGKAITATGIGALVVTVGLLIANFDKVKQVLTNLIPGFGKLADFIGNIVNKVTDFFGLTSQAMRDNEEMIKRLDDTLKFSGDKTDEWGRRKLESAKKLREDIKELNDREDLDEKEKATRIADLRRIHNNNLIQADKDREAAIQKVKDDAHNKALADSEKKAKEQAEKEAENASNIAIWRKEAEDRIKAQYEEEAKKEQEKKSKAGGQTSKEVFKSLGLPTPDETKKIMSQYKDTLKDRIDKEKEAELEVMANKKTISDSTISMTEQVAGAMGKAEEFNKAMALGQVAFDTGVAISKALANSQSPTGDNIATGGLAGIAKFAALASMIIANSIKSVNIIKSKKTPSSTGGGGGSSMPTMNTPQMLPQFNMGDLSQVGRNIPTAGNQRSQVVVTNKDIVEANTVAVSTNNVISL